MFTKILEHKATLAIAGILALGAITWGTITLLGSSSKHYETSKAEVRDVTEAITSTGQVQSEDNVSLAFDRTGTVTSVNVKAGDKVRKGTVLATLDSGDLYASLQGAQADVASAEAKLADIQKGGRTESVGIAQQQISTSRISLESAIRDAYLKADDAVRNKSDVLFTNPDTVTPKFNIPTSQFSVESDIETRRLQAGEKLALWKAQIESNASSDAAVNVSNDTLAFVKAYLDQLGTLTSSLTTSGSGVTQAQINAYRTAVNAAASEVNAGMSSVALALQAKTAAENQLSLTTSPSTPEAIQAAQAGVAKAQASVAGIQSQLRHNVVVAPFDGVVTSAVPKVGELSSAGTPAFGLISQGVYKIDLSIPELDIAKLAIGNKASITLDAYGSDTIFEGEISALDPAETVVNGIGTYKATVLFGQNDTRVKSGMTANVTVVTRTASQAVAIPSAAIITNGSDKFVLVSTGKKDEFIQRKVTVGIMGKDGYAEITSGIQPGELVAGFSTK